MTDTWLKDPDSVLQYKFDWAPLTNGTGTSDWLDTSTSPIESISTYDLFIDSPGPTVDASSISDGGTTVTVKLSGGVLPHTYSLTCRITTSTGQIEDKTATIVMVPK